MSQLASTILAQVLKKSWDRSQQFFLSPTHHPKTGVIVVDLQRRGVNRCRSSTPRGYQKNWLSPLDSCRSLQQKKWHRTPLTCRPGKDWQGLGAQPSANILRLTKTVWRLYMKKDSPFCCWSSRMRLPSWMRKSDGFGHHGHKLLCSTRHQRWCICVKIVSVVIVSWS